MTRVFTGPNSYALKFQTRSLVSEFISKYGELSVERLDGEESSYEQVLSAIESVPFLAEKKLVVLSGVSTNKELIEKIENLIDSAKEGNELMIIEPKIDKRSVYYKYLKSNAELVEFKELDERGLANWLVEQAKEKGAELRFGDASYLVARIGTDQNKAFNEFGKLIDFDKKITRRSIDSLTEAAAQTNIFNLLDSAFSGNKHKTLDIYESQRAQGDDPLKILAMIIWQMHLVALVEAGQERTDDEVMRASGLKPFTLGKTRAIADTMGRDKIRSVLNHLTRLDKQLKTTSVDADDAVKNLLLSIS